MKKLVVLAAVFMLFGALAAQAAPRKQSPKPRASRTPVSGLAQHKGWIAIMPKLGFVVPTGDYGDISGSGFRFQGAAEYYLRSDWTIGVSTAWAQTGASDDSKTAAEATLPAGSTISSWKFRTMQFSGYARHLFPTSSPKISPYVSGGLGIYNTKSSAEGTVATQQEIDAATGSGSGETNLGFNLGGGMMMALTPTVGFNVGMTYHNAFSDPATNYFVFNGGMNFFFNTGR
ncbi:MAG: autotransporter outer membrane beta-barrel domain-containing protein [candidate division Zixibacteria bacterium]|nr:autotransporter outer membrane beta-barrel domain-containing protein [candidate division Zixibacteria bacterium]